MHWVAITIRSGADEVFRLEAPVSNEAGLAELVSVAIEQRQESRPGASLLEDGESLLIERMSDAGRS